MLESMGPKDDFFDPELEFTEDSEISAAVDISTHGDDGIFRPVYINQDEEVLVLTLEDSKRLLKFLEKAVKFLDEYQDRSIQ